MLATFWVFYQTLCIIPIRFLKTEKFIVTDCLLFRKPENPYGKSLFSPIRWRVVASCTVSIDIQSAIQLLSCCSRVELKLLPYRLTLFLDPWKSYQVCWKLKDTTHREIGGSAAAARTPSFFIIHHFQFMSFAFFPSLHSVEKKIDWTLSIISTKMIFVLDGQNDVWKSAKKSHLYFFSKLFMYSGTNIFLSLAT